MGYYTHFNLEAYYKDEYDVPYSVPGVTEEVICAKLAKISGYFHPKMSFLTEIGYDGIKWYNHEQDMIALSKEFPDVYFVLSGVGEEPDDQWIEYYNNGETERIDARIVFDPPKNKIFMGL